VLKNYLYCTEDSNSELTNYNVSTKRRSVTTTIELLKILFIIISTTKITVE